MGMTLGLLTGIAALRALKKQRKGPEALSFGNKIEVVHALDGRLRFRSEILKEEKIVQALIGQLTKVKGIKHVSPSLITGGFLIEYDAKEIDQELLIGAVYKLIGFENDLESISKSKIMSEIQNVNKAMSYALMDKSQGLVDLRTLISLSFIGLAGYKIVSSGTVTSPSAVSLLWWAYNGLEGGKQAQ